MQLVGVDVGGTFTDIIFADIESGETHILKIPTTPEDPARGVRRGIGQLCSRHGLDPAGLDHVLHGTTIATNAVLEHRGARTGMLTTAGYRDILHIGRHQRPEHYSIMQEIPWQERPLVKRRHRLTVKERLIPPTGDVLEPLDEGAVRQAAEQFAAEGIESIAVCFLFSYLNPVHEARAEALLRELLPGCFVTTSSGVAPQFREFERFTTAAMNAFIGPPVHRYIGQLAAGLESDGLSAELTIMGSHGGAAHAAAVQEQPILTLLSGPAAGVLGGAWSGALSDCHNLITFDVGGTSADIGIVVDGRFQQALARDTAIAGYPVLAPMIDIHTIGAGGGSVAQIDAGGGLRVGPRSAGARPGPAAYGFGGEQPTVTDAQVVLGRLRAEHFLGGEMALDEEAARRVITEYAGAANLPATQAAAGILTILNANMANAIRSRTVQKGLDPRNFALVAFGGAGPLSAAEVAGLLSIPNVIIPSYPGLTSALGLLTTDLRYDAVRTEFQVSDAVDCSRLTADFAAMEAQLLTNFGDSGPIEYRRSGDLRYVGQGYELEVPFPLGTITAQAVDSVLEQFHGIHEAEYGHAFPDSDIEIVNIRATGTRAVGRIGSPAVPSGSSLDDALIDTAPCFFSMPGGVESFPTGFFARDRLPLDTPLEGPAIIVQTDSTTVVPPGANVRAQRNGNLIITLESPT